MYQLYGNGFYDGRFIGYSSAYLPEEEFEQNVDENGEPCYHEENKIQEDSQMSHLVSMKSKYYLIMASDSFNIRGPKTDKHYQKLFPFPGEGLLIGITGVTTIHEFGSEQEVGVHVKKIMDDQSAPLNERIHYLCDTIQKGLRGADAVTQIHLAKSKGSSMEYQLITIEKDKCLTETHQPEYYIRTTGIMLPAPDIYSMEGRTKKQCVEIIMRSIKAVSQYELLINKQPRVGGRIQCYVLNADGQIEDFSEEKCMDGPPIL